MIDNFEEVIVFDYWNKWADSLEGTKAADDKELQHFCSITGARINSPMALMFYAFKGGMAAGFSLFDLMNEAAEAKKQAK